MTDLAEALMRGPRGRRLCLEYVMRTDDEVRSAVFWLGYQQDSHPGVTFVPLAGNDSAHQGEPTSDGVAALIDGVMLDKIREDIVREALQSSVDRARYWQEPDGEDREAASTIERDACPRAKPEIDVQRLSDIRKFVGDCGRSGSEPPRRR